MKFEDALKIAKKHSFGENLIQAIETENYYLFSFGDPDEDVDGDIIIGKNKKRMSRLTITDIDISELKNSKRIV